MTIADGWPATKPATAAARMPPTDLHREEVDANIQG